MPFIILNDIPEHAEDPEELVEAIVREDGVVPDEIVGRAELPANFIQAGLVLVLVLWGHLVG